MRTTAKQHIAGSASWLQVHLARWVLGSSIFCLCVASRCPCSQTNDNQLQEQMPWTVCVVDRSGSVGRHSSACVADGRPVIVYGDDQERRIRLAMAEVAAPGGRFDWAITVLDTLGEKADFPTVAQENGRLHLAYYCDGELRYASSEIADCQRADSWEVSVIDSAKETGWLPAIALSGGLPVISYYDLTEGDLMLASLTGPPTASEWSRLRVEEAAVSFHETVTFRLSVCAVREAIYVCYPRTPEGMQCELMLAVVKQGPDGLTLQRRIALDSSGNAGHYASMLVIEDRLGIAYYDQDSGHVCYTWAELAVNEDAGAWHTMTVDPGKRAGSTCSVGLISGVPAIAYFDLARLRLRIARATSAEPRSSDDWLREDVCEYRGLSGRSTTVFQLGSAPAIAYHIGEPENNLGFALRRAD